MTAVTPGTRGNQFNFVTSGARQPGSTFKTIALTTAVSEGLNPFTTTYLSAPFHYAPLKWNVQTYEHTYAGNESARERDDAVGQHRVRAALARRRCAEHR